MLEFLRIGLNIFCGVSEIKVAIMLSKVGYLLAIMGTHKINDSWVEWCRD